MITNTLQVGRAPARTPATTTTKGGGGPQLAKHIADAIDDGDVPRMFINRGAQPHMRTVDFFHNSPPDDGYSNRYVILVSATLPARKDRGELVCLFPNHRTPKRQVLRASSYWELSSMNKDINAAFADSLEETAGVGAIKMAVAYGEHVFVCRELTGTIYVVWADYINRINQGNVANTIYSRCPLLINCDGQGRPKAIFVLRPKIPYTEMDLLPIRKGNPCFMYPREPLFVCEVRPPPNDPPHVVPTISRRNAHAIATAPTKDASTWLHYEQNVFSSAATPLEGSDVDDGVSWSDSPRVAFEGPVLAPETRSLKTRERALSFVRVERSAEEGGVVVHDEPRDPFDEDEPPQGDL